jgi:hypothetical protein
MTKPDIKVKLTTTDDESFELWIYDRLEYYDTYLRKQQAGSATITNLGPVEPKENIYHFIHHMREAFVYLW